MRSKYIQTCKRSKGAVAVFRQSNIDGNLLATPVKNGVKLIATFTKLPTGKHGFHIHRAGDLRMKDCSGLCEHFDKGNHHHGDAPHSNSKKERHTGDLGNIGFDPKRKTMKKRYFLKNVLITDLWGRSAIIHADKDDLGKGSHPDSHTTGHSGSRIGCAIFGRL